ncbi:MAG: alpha/beta hydrolase [Microvirga sp.]
MVIAMHGLDRAASDFRDCWIGAADRLGLLVVVPEFDREAFPTIESYNYGNVRDSNGTVSPRELWSFAIIERLFAFVANKTGSQHRRFNLFGNSAGAQFVLRYLALNQAPAVHAAVAANCGWYMRPDLGLEYPMGMGGLDLDPTCLARYLRRRLIIVLGDADNDALAPDLPRSDAAMAQGPHRLARGLWHFDLCERLAQLLGVDFGWRLEIVPGAGHVDQIIFDTSAALIAASA